MLIAFPFRFCTLLRLILLSLAFNAHAQNVRVGAYENKPKIFYRCARHAIRNFYRNPESDRRLRKHYQPQVSLKDGSISGAEALLRWAHPQLGAISPAEFIPIAESSGQIIPIGEWVIRTATRQLKSWLDQGYPAMVMVVNLSAAQFRQPNLPELVTSILAEANLPHQYFELELTEAVTAIISMASSLGMLTIAERVETAGNWNFYEHSNTMKFRNITSASLCQRHSLKPLCKIILNCSTENTQIPSGEDPAFPLPVGTPALTQQQFRVPVSPRSSST